jgi:hypothetical protein
MKRSGYILLGVWCLLAFIGTAVAQTPPAPMDLVAKVTNQVPVGIELQWHMPPVMPPLPPTVFKVFRSVDDSTSFKLLNITNRTGYDDRQVVPGHAYFYFVTTVWVFADSSVRESGKSNIASATLLPPPGGKAGEIVGTVTDSLSGKPIPFARLFFFRPVRPMLFAPQAIADSAGKYRAVLDTGTYLINCQAPVWMSMMASPLPPYRSEWYKNASEPSSATPVHVSEGSTTVIDFDLVRFTPPPVAHLRGTVRDSAGNPLKGAVVAIMRTVQEMNPGLAASGDVSDIAGESMTIDGIGCVRGVLWKGLTDSTGKFDAALLAGRAYIALAVKGGYIPQFFDHKSNPAEATIIKVSGDVENIDFNLNPVRPPQVYSIGGVVKDSADVRVPSRIIVFPLRPRLLNAAIRFTFTDSLGAYTVQKLPAGKYLVLAIPFGRYAPAFYKKGEFGVIHWKKADTVLVAGNVTGIDIGVVQVYCTGIARLRGIVRANGLVLDGANVIALNSDGATIGYGMTDNAGSYEIEGLGAGSVTVLVDHEGYNEAQQTIGVAGTDYTLSQDFSLGVATSVLDRNPVPQSYTLSQNYPNPFNPGTRISFAIPSGGTVTLKIYNLLGQEVATLLNGFLAAGNHDAEWNGRDGAGNAVATGVYFYRLEVSGANGTPGFEAMRKMILLK